jgi:hypothetical protein
MEGWSVDIDRLKGLRDEIARSCFMVVVYDKDCRRECFEELVKLQKSDPRILPTVPVGERFVAVWEILPSKDLVV